MSDDVVDLSDVGGERGDNDGRSAPPKQRELAKKNIEAIEQRITGLDYAAKRIEETDDDKLVMQQVEGNVLIEVPPDERDEVREKIVELRDHLKQQKEELEQMMG